MGQEPKALREKPEILPDLVDTVHAFFVLSRSRQVGEAPSPILVSEMICYATHFGLDDDLEAFIAYIQEADDVYLKHYMEKVKQQYGKLKH